MFYLDSSSAAHVCITNTSVYCKMYLEIQGCSLMRISVALDPGTTSWLVMHFCPTRNFAAVVVVDMSHWAQAPEANPGLFRDYNVFQLSRGQQELPQEEPGKGTCGLLFKPAATVTLPKGVCKKWLADQRLSALLRKGEITIAPTMM